MGNSRGNGESAGAEEYRGNSQRYWNFTFEESGTGDLIAAIDFILEETKATNPASRIDAFIGHSLGATEFLAAASLMPEYFEKRIGLFVGLAPVTRIAYIQDRLFRALAEVYPAFEMAVKLTNSYHMFKYDDKN